MLRIVFFGTPTFAVRTLDALLASQHEVVGVITQPDRPRDRGQRVTPSPVKARAEAAGVPIWQPDRLKEDAFLHALEMVSPTIGVVAAYGKLLPEILLALPQLGMVNVHGSLLPRYRGAAPIQRVIMDGATETGVTIMRVIKAMDAGPTFASRSTAIGPDETAEELEGRLALLGAELLVEVLDAIERGEAVETPQDDSKATYAPRIVKPDGLIKWDRSAQTIHDQVRALHPWPHAFTFGDGQRYVIHQTRPHPALANDVERGPEAPGTVVSTRGGQLLVAAGEGTALEIVRLQEEGRRVVTAREFLAGRSLPVGSRFTWAGA